MKRKIISVIGVLMLTIFLCVNISATEALETDIAIDINAEETVDSAADAFTSEDLAEDEKPAEEGESVEQVNETSETIFTRLWEYVTTYKTEIFGLIGDAAIFIVALLAKNGVSLVKKTARSTNDSQNSVVGVVNEMVDGYNALKEAYDKYGLTEDDRNRVVGALVAQNTAILEILTTIYVNSKNLPQGIKDIVMLKYANCLKALDDDEKLKAVVTSVREGIGTKILIDEVAEEDTAETEE